MGHRNRYLFVCVNRRPHGTPKGSCATRGAEALHAALKAEVAARGLGKTEVRACTSSCLDVCWAGPVVHVSPDGTFYGRVQLSDIPDICNALAKGEVVERLVLGPHEFEEATAGPKLPEQPPPAQEG